MSYQAWNKGVNPLVLAWTAAILIFSWWLFFYWQRMHNTDGSARDMKLFKLQTVANSELWWLGMALFYPMIYGDEKKIVTIVMAGSLAIGTIGYSRAPHAASTDLGIQTDGNSTVADRLRAVQDINT